MLFSEFVRTSKIAYEVDSALIAIGNRTWQTRNISSVGVSEHVGELGVVEPRVAMSAKPKRNFRWGIVALGIATSWTVAMTTDRPAVVGWIGSLLAIGFFSFVGHYAYKNKLSEWKRVVAKTADHHKIWKHLTSSPPKIYSITFDSSSGREDALIALDQAAVLGVRTAILDAIRNPSISTVRGSLTVLVLGTEKPNDLVRRYYDQLTEQPAQRSPSNLG